QAEFELVRVTPAGVVRATEALPALGLRPEPCDTDTAGVVAWMFAHDDDGQSPARTELVIDRDGRARQRVTIDGWYGAGAVGGRGAVLDGVASGADGDLGRSRVDLAWVSAAGTVGAHRRLSVGATEPSVALDPRTARVAVAGSSAPAIVYADGRGRPSAP